MASYPCQSLFFFEKNLKFWTDVLEPEEPQITDIQSDDPYSARPYSYDDSDYDSRIDVGELPELPDVPTEEIIEDECNDQPPPVCEPIG